MSPHRIRLRGPWQFRVLSDSLEPISKGRIQLPADWTQVISELSDSTHCVEFERNFHRPTGLTETSLVFLVLEGIPFESQVRLNGRSIPGSNPTDVYRADITPLLEAHNLLAIRLELDRKNHCHGHASLEIVG